MGTPSRCSQQDRTCGAPLRYGCAGKEDAFRPALQAEPVRPGLWQWVEVESEKNDRYGRLVGKILVNERDANLAQIHAGMAWHYKAYQREQTAPDRRIYAETEKP